MDQTAPPSAQVTVHLAHAHRQMGRVWATVKMATMDLIAPTFAPNTVHLVSAQKQMAPVLKNALMVTMATSVMKHVPTAVIGKDVTNRVESVLLVVLDFMAVTVS